MYFVVVVVVVVNDSWCDWLYSDHRILTSIAARLSPTVASLTSIALSSVRKPVYIGCTELLNKDDLFSF